MDNSSKNIKNFIKKWTSFKAWKDLFIPENPSEHHQQSI